MNRPGPKSRPLLDRLWEKVRILSENECWLYLGGTNKNGYGQIGGGRRSKERGYVHKLVLEQKLGRPLRPGLEACHTCHVRACCNPNHLYEGTHSQNQGDMTAAGRQQRREGHWNAKLTPHEVEIIRMDPRSSPQVAKEYPVNARTIRKIREGKLWMKE